VPVGTGFGNHHVNNDTPFGKLVFCVFNGQNVCLLVVVLHLKRIKKGTVHVVFVMLYLHCKKGLAIYLFPAMESLVSDIPAEDGKIALFF
jgi:hypothetical protein